jgi:phytoene dehydrogenase-like protein
LADLSEPDGVERDRVARGPTTKEKRPVLARLLVQQSQVDPIRAPPGKQTGCASCHVPAGSTKDLTATIEAQVERIAPGFGDRILARHAMTTADFDQCNPSLVGSAITGGVTDLAQLFTRPVARLSPYASPHPRVFIRSSSNPPGCRG